MKIVKHFLIIFCCLSLLWASSKPQPFQELPAHMKSYKNYLIVLVHGMQSNAEGWDSFDFKEELANLVNDPDFSRHIYAYTFDDPNGSYQANGPQLGDRNNAECWLAKARQEFIGSHPTWPAARPPRNAALPARWA